MDCQGHLRQIGLGTLQYFDDWNGQFFLHHPFEADVSSKVDRLGTRVADEIEQVLTTIGAAEGSASSYSAHLAKASRRLGAARDRDGVRALVESLVVVAKEMEATNVKLQDQMQAMWEEVAQFARKASPTR